MADCRDAAERTMGNSHHCCQCQTFRRYTDDADIAAADGIEEDKRTMGWTGLALRLAG